MSTGPSVRVCRMNLPSNFSEVPSSTVSTQRLGQQPRDRLRIVVAAEDLVEHRPELDGAAAHVERADLEGHDMVVAGKAELAELSVLSISHMHQTPGGAESTRSERAAFEAQFADDEALR